MAEDNWTEPLENPFAPKARAPSAPPAASEDTDPSAAITVTSADAVAAPPVIAAKSAKRGSKTGPVAPPPVPPREEAPPVEAEAVVDAEAPEWLRTASKPPAPKPPQKKGCFWACLRCCGRTHRTIVGSSVCTTVFLSLSTILLFSFWVLSLVFLKERVQAGNCAAPAALCPLGGFADAKCMSFGYVGQQCDSVCDAAAAANAAPFAFTLNGFSGSSGSFLENYVFCPFPKMNSNWRIPLTFFATLVGCVAIFALCKKWLKTLFAVSFLRL
jgi:hypothetical protein